ncbi:hypothetical protein K3495_g15093 [Podosphaera aphanis]|nr:hypothetical protein K3495_g15093 [Podosphaera aphanis]
MWIGIWAIGILFYIFMGISVWIEGIAIFDSPVNIKKFISISQPSLKTIMALTIFAVASSTQHVYHKHLASLKKYTLPNHFLSRWIVCPHYTSECLIYIAIALISAPPDLVFNRTVLAGLTFVISNLAVTADATKTWYQEKFGVEKVKNKWRMIPLIF